VLCTTLLFTAVVECTVKAPLPESTIALELVRTLEGNGFQRNLSTLITVTATTTATATGATTATVGQQLDCRVALVQLLPATVFIDDLRVNSMGVGPPPAAVTWFSPQRVEAIAEHAAAQTVVLFTTVHNGVGAVWLTVHTRYHRAVPTGGVVPPIPIDPSRVFLDCSDGAGSIPTACTAEAADLHGCTAALAAHWVDKGVVGEPVRLAGIARGNTDHVRAIVVVTVVCVLTATLWVAAGIRDAPTLATATSKKRA
jgi:hypothetical protein